MKKITKIKIEKYKGDNQKWKREELGKKYHILIFWKNSDILFCLSKKNLKKNNDKNIHKMIKEIMPIIRDAIENLYLKQPKWV